VLAGAALVGALQGYLIGRFQIPSFVATLGTFGMFSGIALYLSSSTTIAVTSDVWTFDFLSGRSAGVPNAIWLLVFIWLLLFLLLRYTRLGREVYYLGASELASYMSGISRNATRAFVFGVSGLCAALSGTMLLSQTLYSSPTVANDLLLPAIVGVVVGGTAVSGGVGGVTLSLIGGLTIIFVRVGATLMGFAGAVQDIAFGVIILCAVALTTDHSKIVLLK
jgi:ribose transport system permease protein